MGDGPLAVLLVSADEADFRLITQRLGELPAGRYRLDIAADFSAARSALERGEHAVCLVGGAAGGEELLAEARSGGCRVPLVVLAGERDREVALAAIEAGAADFLLREQLTADALERSLRYALRCRRLKEELRSAQEGLKQLAHALRNPLSSLTTSCELIKLEPASAEQVRELAALMSRQLEQLQGLIEALVERPRPSGEELTPLPPAVDGDEALPALRVLVVDDDASASHLLSRVLQKLGQHVQIAQSADEALELLPTLAADAVISDIAMPGVTGYELAARIRKLPLARQPMLVALTGYGQPSDRREALAAGFDEHLKKPIVSAELRGLIARLSRVNPRN